MLALFVRFADRIEQPTHASGLVGTAADVRLVRRQHRVFYALLLAAPLEWWWRGRPHGWVQLAGIALFALGVTGYRRAGGVLGEQLSPLLAPREPARLVDEASYGRVRHPMYRAELAMAFGAPWMLGAAASVLLAVAFSAVLLHRMALEERALRARFPGYGEYAARTYRLIPYVY